MVCGLWVCEVEEGIEPRICVWIRMYILYPSSKQPRYFVRDRYEKWYMYIRRGFVLATAPYYLVGMGYVLRSEQHTAILAVVLLHRHFCMFQNFAFTTSRVFTLIGGHGLGYRASTLQRPPIAFPIVGSVVSHHLYSRIYQCTGSFFRWHVVANAAPTSESSCLRSIIFIFACACYRRSEELGALN